MSIASIKINITGSKEERDRHRFNFFLIKCFKDFRIHFSFFRNVVFLRNTGDKFERTT